ncbi:MAG: aminotransferase [Planctomycetaceae bacterium]|nr:aminotransferase [Planctomycetaceae bacterium]
MKNLATILIRVEDTIRTALARLDRAGWTILLLVDEDGVLLRTVTDGDLRRLLLANRDLESTLDQLEEQHPRTVSRGASTDLVLRLMNRCQVDQVPEVDEDGRPVDLHLRREIDQPVLLSPPHLADEERKFVEQAFATNWIAPVGPNIDAFETEIAATVGMRSAAALSSGTAAIHLGLKLLGVGPGDRVFCSSLTFVATVNPIRYLDAEPVFIDSEPGTWNMSPAALARALEAADRSGNLPRAVVPVGLYGQSPDMEPILELCDRYGIPVLEDAAESLGATYRGRAAGTFGRLGIYSFNGNKIITTSGGGMLVGDDESLIERARFLATQARTPAGHYEHDEVGFNYRMSNILAGIGRGQLQVLGDRVERRRRIFERYRSGLEDVEAIRWMPEPAGHRSTRWLTAATIDPNATDRDLRGIVDSLADAGIEARRIWKPMHRQPVFAGAGYWPHHPRESVSDRLFETGLCLPSGSGMTEQQQDRVVRRVRERLAAPIRTWRSATLSLG